MMPATLLPVYSAFDGGPVSQPRAAERILHHDEGGVINNS